MEDLHTCYWEEFGGGLNVEATFVNQAKKLVDSLNADHSRGKLQGDFFSRNTFGIHFYDSVAVFERGSIPYKVAPKFGTEPRQKVGGGLSRLFK